MMLFRLASESTIYSRIIRNINSTAHEILETNWNVLIRSTRNNQIVEESEDSYTTYHVRLVRKEVSFNSNNDYQVWNSAVPQNDDRGEL